MADRILIGIASIPEREQTLKRVIAALATQADRIHVALNDYTRHPRWLGEFSNVTAEVTPMGNLGDAEKFRAVGDWDGIAATCDDDVLYPSDYVQRLVSGLERHGRHCVVGFHGGTTLGWNGRHGAAQDKRIRCLDKLRLDDPDVNVLGTGVMAWDTRHVPVWRELFRHANCADVQFACHTHRFGIPMSALAHDAGWLRDICPSEGRRIYESNANGDGSARDTRAVRKRLIGSVDWSLPARRPRVRVSIATCDRPELLTELLADLVEASRSVEVELSVYHDPTDADYADARATVAEHGWGWHTFGRRLGKAEHWRLVNQQMRDAQSSKADWFLFLPDDVRLARSAIPKAIDIFGALRKPATLTLWRLRWLEGQANWTGRKPVDGPEAAEVFHIDGLYLAPRSTLAALNFRCPEARRPPEQAHLGSGVGSRLSRLLHAKGLRMYRVNDSLVIPNDGGVSIMNPLERSLHPAEVVAA